MGVEASYINAFCRACNAPRYRSIRPMRRDEQARPEMFVALDPGAPAPSEGRAACYVCEDTLVFTAETRLAPLSTPKEELFQPESQEIPEPSRSSLAVEVLFRLDPGEEMKSFNDYPTHVIVATNKRIVRVNKG